MSMHGLQERLLIWSGRGLGRLDHVHNRLWQGAQQDAEDGRFDCKEKASEKTKECDDSQKSSSEGPNDGEDEQP